MTFNFNEIFKQEDWDNIILTDNPPCKNCEHKIEFEKLYPGAAYYDQPPECRYCIKSSEYTIRCIQKLAYLEEKERHKPVYTHCNEELNTRVAELMEDYTKLVEKAKSYGLDIRLYDQSETLELYFNDDYPDTLLVDKDLSSLKRIQKGETI